jgi:hypothetical protein
MSKWVLTKRLAWGVLLLGVVGCGRGGVAPPVETPPNAPLEEIGTMVKQFTVDKGRPPKNLRELQPYEPGFMIGHRALAMQEVVLAYGVPVSEGADANVVLAYDKNVPAQGGFVLMQNGSVKKMSADEFKAATKAKGL